MRRWLALAGALCFGAPVAFAQDLSSAANPSDDLWAELENLPPRASYDLAVNVSYGDITYWRSKTGPFLGFGIETGWGKHIGESRRDRIGAAVGLVLEGPAPAFFTVALEPQATWDRVSNGLLLGASVGPTLLLHSEFTRTGQLSKLGFTPMVSARVGWSQPFSRVSRRMFVVVEPKLRYIADLPNFGAAIVVGSGEGY